MKPSVDALACLLEPEKRPSVVKESLEVARLRFYDIAWSALCLSFYPAGGNIYPSGPLFSCLVIDYGAKWDSGAEASRICGSEPSG